MIPNGESSRNGSNLAALTISQFSDPAESQGCNSEESIGAIIASSDDAHVLRAEPGSPLLPIEENLFAFAGLWDEWKNPEGKVIESCTVLTTTPNTLLANIHGRMPVIVTPDEYELWLHPEAEDFDSVREILEPYDPSLMRHYPVSQRLNSAQNDDADCATPITLELPAQAPLF
jgi:hypothetical protein